MQNRLSIDARVALGWLTRLLHEQKITFDPRTCLAHVPRGVMLYLKWAIYVISAARLDAAAAS